jgi:VWFA-related protein
MRTAAQSLLLSGLLICSLELRTPASSHADDTKARIAALAPKYRAWLEEVDLLLRKEERQQFLALSKDYQRDGFIHRFWEARNPVPGSNPNPFKAQWESRLDAIREEYGNVTEDRARMRLMHGAPSAVLETDCGMALWPLEIWHYAAGERMPHDFYLVFYAHGGASRFRLWRHADGLGELIARRTTVDPADLKADHNYTAARGQHYPDESLYFFTFWARDNCGGLSRTVITAVDSVERADQGALLDQLLVPPPPRDVEWLATFQLVSTDLPAGALPLPARLAVTFPARHHGSTVVQAVVLVGAGAAVPGPLADRKAYNFLLSGEVLAGSELVESFRYRFDLPAGPAGTTAPAPAEPASPAPAKASPASPAPAQDAAADELPLAFERALPPGDYVLVLRVEDLHSHRNFRIEEPLTVPPAAGLPETGAPAEAPVVAAAIEAARAELRTAGASADRPAAADDAAVRLIPPPGETQTGGVRLAAQAAGKGLHKVTFYLDGKEMLSRLRPPYSVELNLGPVPLTREVRAVGYDASGRELASDSLVLNPPKQRFAVRLVEPRAGNRYRGPVLARAEVRVPDGATLDRLELLVDDQRVATLYQPPFVQLLPLRAAAAGAANATFVRAVAYLGDGTTAEDLAVINSPDPVERIDVRLVEISAAVFDHGGRPVASLGPADFQVWDGGEPQTVLRCERVRDLPLHLLLAIDTSASMAPSLPQVQQAALTFLTRTLTTRDRAALLTFSDTPLLRLPFTDDLRLLGGALAGLDAQRGTALFDSLVYGLSYMKGAQHGQSALLLFTDGGDHLSHLGFDEALAFARHAGIPIYAIGVRVPRLNRGDRGRLEKLAAETGGRSFFVEAAAELDGIYATIADELRSRYLIAYQPNAAPRAGVFRPVEVRVAGAGLRVKTVRGYYP